MSSAPPPSKWRALLGLLLGVVARIWLRTLRVTVQVHPALEGEAAHRPWVLAFFHGTQWPLLAWRRRRRTAVMVSLSADGAMQACALSVLGFAVVRGSSSRGGARGLAAVVRLLRRGDHDAAFAVDGPRGPYGLPKPGVFVAAARGGAVLVPMGAAVACGKVFHRAWDRFTLAWPFSRVAVVLGPPIEVGQAPDRTLAGVRLAEAIASANVAAEAILSVRKPVMIPSHWSTRLPLPGSGIADPRTRSTDL
jgi:lysophospholipid acyltransferase (LPLAT)-like uncharacterized protein